MVTGGANGIGKATALMLAKHGTNIVIADLKLEEAKTAAKEIKALGVKVLAIECNVLQDDHLVSLTEQTVDEFGAIHILINNAGGGGGRENPFKVEVEDIKRDFELNVFSGWRLGTADDIAGTMLYFASSIFEWVSGQTLFVNGGGVQTLE